MTLHHGDCLEVMAAMEPESVDAVVCDPPYGLGFMSKVWDSDFEGGDSPMRRRRETNAVNAGMSRQGGRQWRGEDGQKRQRKDGMKYQAWCQQWAEAAYRVAKPSAYLLAFGGTRTFHRLACAIEDAGWIIRDTLVWGYASGFPKSKASLKPAWEPIVMARKPGPLRDLAIDACRIGTTVETWPASRSYAPGQIVPGGVGETQATGPVPPGRWPANIVLTNPIFDGGWEGVVGGGEAVSRGGAAFSRAGYDGGWTPPNDGTIEIGYGDSGTYSRFFLIPKADRADREPVLGGLPKVTRHMTQVTQWAGHSGNGPDGGPPTRANHHPTVKPTDLMRHLVRLVTPAGGVVLDPFLGSGTTALAAEMEGFSWIGIEKEAEYVAIAEARLNGVQKGLGLDVGAPLPPPRKAGPDKGGGTRCSFFPGPCEGHPGHGRYGPTVHASPEHSHVWVDGDFVLNGCSLPHPELEETA